MDFTFDDDPSISTDPAPTKKSYPFILRSINPHEIFNNFRSGQYFRLGFCLDVPLHSTDRFDDSIQTDDRCQERFLQNRHGVTVDIVTSQQRDYENALGMLATPERIHLKKEGTCHWCRRNLETIPNDPYGVAINMKRSGSKGNYRYVFSITGKVCTPECSMALCKYTYPESLLINRFMFSLLIGDVKVAKDWRLHRRNGGPLNDENYYDPQVDYIPTSNVICIPTKQEFIRTQIKN